MSSERKRSVSGGRSPSPKVKKEEDDDARDVQKRNASPRPEKRARRWDKAEGGRRWDVAAPNVKMEDDGCVLCVK